VQADLLPDDEPERLVAEAWAPFSGPGVLFNNVGVNQGAPLPGITRDHFEFIFRLNVWVPVAVSREVVRRAIPEKRGGRILFSTSLNGTRSEPLHTLYD